MNFVWKQGSGTTLKKAWIQGRSRPRLSFLFNSKEIGPFSLYICMRCNKTNTTWFILGKQGIYIPSVLATGLSPLGLRLRGDRPVASTSAK